jgi:hypothetical protein
MKEILIFSATVMGTIFIGSALFILAANKLENYFNQFKK